MRLRRDIKDAHQRNSKIDNPVIPVSSKIPKRRSPLVLFILLGGVTVASLIIVGLDPFNIWQRPATPKAAFVPMASAPLVPRPVAPPTPRGNDSSISAKPLTLMLVQVHLGRNATEGSAEIGVVQESPQTYLAGAVLENGARLAEIHADYVLLQRNGRSERLYLEGASKSARARDSGLLMVGGSLQTPVAAPITSHETLTDYLRPSPKFEGTELLGLEVYPGKNSAIFWQMGFKAGDVITAVDGAPIHDAVFALEQLRSLAEGSAITVTITRGQESHTLALDGSYVLNDQEQRATLVSTAAFSSPPRLSP